MRVGLGSWNAAWRDEPLPYVAGALIFASVLFGGGGEEGPLQNGMLEALGALLLGGLAALHINGKSSLAHSVTAILWLTVAALSLILLQVVPLPPAIWSAFPGRETALAVDLLVNNQISWRPWSLDPEATQRTAAALLLPLPIALIVAGATRKGLLFMLRALLAAALISAALGGVQLALGSPQSLAPYGEPVPSATGVFANSNHHASLMLCAVVATGILIRLDTPSLDIRLQSGRWRLHLGWLLIPVFSIMSFAAMSRAGWALLMPALALSLLISIGRRHLLSILMVCGITMVGMGVAVLTTGSLSSEIQDVQALLQDDRLMAMPDILFTLQQFWPIGSGLGTFVPVFKANENLDLVTSSYLAHAHNDVLELLIETGIFGATLLAIAVVLVLTRLWNVSHRGSGSELTVAVGGAGILTLLFLHSLVDFPVRTDAIAAVAGLAIGLLVNKAQKIDPGRYGKPFRRKSRRGFGSPAASRWS